MIVEQVKKIVAEAAQALSGADVLGPFMAFGSDGMGIQIKMPQTRGYQECELIANFVIAKRDVEDVNRVHEIAEAAVNAIKYDIQIGIRVKSEVQT